jgi:hypothetical protein
VQTPEQQTASIRHIPGPKVLLLGGTGTGKTYSIRTLVEAGLEVFVLFTEPGMEGLADIPSDKLHWHYIPPASPDWADLIDSAEKINNLSFKTLAGLEDINKRKYTGLMDVYKNLANFTDDRTGKSFGPVDFFDETKALVVDSLSGLNILAMNLVVGSKPVKSQADWAMAMDNLERFIVKLTTDVFCPVVLLGHLEREQDEVTGGSSVMVSTLGKKLAPKIPRFFSDVINSKRDASKFTWSTTTFGMDLKTRNLGFADNLAPSFVPIIKNWQDKLASERKAVVVDNGLTNSQQTNTI